ncbi:PilZ domain-containing protein [Aneurinibacillus sp. REN35]|uniref:PilZ domain-containing protein n=1 Tax=Aneurinibacillus sp. REN35 TaxID=3237286 RepID=UPI0035292212
MEYKRKEGFRLVFSDGIVGTFNIIKIGDRYVHSKPGEVRIHDLSLKGAKVSTSLALPAQKEQMQIELHFTVYEQPFVVRGSMAWKREEQGRYYYGVSFDEESYSASDLFEELKLYARKRKELKSEAEE